MGCRVGREVFPVWKSTVGWGGEGGQGRGSRARIPGRRNKVYNVSHGVACLRSWKSLGTRLQEDRAGVWESR